MRKTIAILTILLLVIFMVGCENSVNPTISDTQNMSLAKADGETMSLAKKGGKNDGCATIQSGELLTSTGDVITTGFDDWGYNYQGHMFRGYYCDSYRDAEWCQPYTDVKLIMKWNDAWLSNKDCDSDGLLDRHFGFTSYIGSGAWLTNHQSGEYTIWDVTGEWIIDVELLGVIYPETLILTQSGTAITGVSLNLIQPTSGAAFTVTGGSVIGNEINIYLDQDNGSKEVHMEGIIAVDGSMSGTWADVAPGSRSGEWTSTSGEAAGEICKWNYFVKIVAAPADAESVDGIWYNADGVEIGPAIWEAFAIIQQVENDKCAGIHGLQYNSPDHSGFGGW